MLFFLLVRLVLYSCDWCGVGFMLVSDDVQFYFGMVCFMSISCWCSWYYVGFVSLWLDLCGFFVGMVDIVLVLCWYCQFCVGTVNLRLLLFLY